MLTMYHIALILHIIGIILLAGVTLVDYVLFRQFWLQVAIDRPGALGVQQGLSKLAALIRLGGILLVLSGVAMMAITRGAFGEQLWFRVKFILIIFIIINGIGLGRRQGKNLRRLLTAGGPAAHGDTAFLTIQKRLRLFHLLQLMLLLSIFILSVFKFN